VAGAAVSDDYISVRELLGLDPRDCLGECSRCGGSPFPLLQLRVIGHQVALCRTCLHYLLGLLEHGTAQRDRPVSPEFHPLAWWTLRDGDLIGVVALIDREHRYWKAYIGRVCGPTVEAQDAATIGHFGVHVGESVALSATLACTWASR
jgi:hypothetical protein